MDSHSWLQKTLTYIYSLYARACAHTHTHTGYILAYASELWWPQTSSTQMYENMQPCKIQAIHTNISLLSLRSGSVIIFMVKGKTYGSEVIVQVTKSLLDPGIPTSLFFIDKWTRILDHSPFYYTYLFNILYYIWARIYICCLLWRFTLHLAKCKLTDYSMYPIGGRRLDILTCSKWWHIPMCDNR